MQVNSTLARIEAAMSQWEADPGCLVPSQPERLADELTALRDEMQWSCDMQGLARDLYRVAAYAPTPEAIECDWDPWTDFDATDDQ